MFRRGLAASAVTVLATATFLVSADRQVIAPVLPAMARDLHATIGATAGVVSAYLFTYGLFEMAYGNLADRHGRLRVMGLAMQVFGLGTLATGLMPNLPTVIALRALTGAGAAAVFPLGLTYLGDTVALSRRQAAIGSINTAAALGQAFSVALGGLVAQLAS
jgi:MFS family permease